MASSKTRARMNAYDEDKSMALTVHRVVCYVVLTIFAILAVFFFYVMIINATRGSKDIQTSFSLLPGSQLVINFKNAIDTSGNVYLLQGLLNSFIVAGLSAVLSVYFSAFTAYGIHVYNFPGKKFIFNFILLIMMIPTQIYAVGFFRQMQSWGLVDTFVPLIVPSIAAPSVFFFMKQYMDSSLPLEIVEAARIDGSNEFRTFNEIIMPILKPAIAVQAIFSFTSSWNNYFMPALILSEEKMRTMPIWISQLNQIVNGEIDLGKIYMSLAIAIVPVMIIYFCFSKFIVAGVTLGSVKG